MNKKFFTVREFLSESYSVYHNTKTEEFWSWVVTKDTDAVLKFLETSVSLCRSITGLKHYSLLGFDKDLDYELRAFDRWSSYLFETNRHLPLGSL